MLLPVLKEKQESESSGHKSLMRNPLATKRWLRWSSGGGGGCGSDAPGQGVQCGEREDDDNNRTKAEKTYCTMLY